MTAVLFDQAEQPPRLRLSGPWTIAEAAGLRTTLLEVIKALPAGELRVDLDGIDEIDSADWRWWKRTSASASAGTMGRTRTVCPSASTTSASHDAGYAPVPEDSTTDCTVTSVGDGSPLPRAARYHPTPRRGRT